MPTITFSLKDLQDLVGKKLKIAEVRELAHYGKGDFEGYDEVSDEVKIDFGDTNMPYLWSVEGFARLTKGILGIEKGIPEIVLHSSSYEVVVDKSVLKNRPFISCFTSKGRKIDDYLIKQLVQLQEKYCETYGRRRQKVSIGLYSYKRLSFPVHYRAVEPASAAFVPLEFKSKMDLNEILAHHPKGREYAWILKGFDKYPILADDKGEIMSFVPVINSNFTGRLEIGDDSLFFEATGTDEESVTLAANIFAHALSDRGFTIYSCLINYPERKVFSPVNSREAVHIKDEHIRRLFGLELKEFEVKELLRKMRYDFNDYKVVIPAYRKDILHPYDIIEDIGISYGYDRIKEEPLSTFTMGSSLELNKFVDRIREIVAGLGYQEIMSAILTNKSLLYQNMNLDDTGTIEIEDYLSETYSVVRSWILPNLMETLSKNKHVSSPQKIFEEGIVSALKGESAEEFNRIAIASSHDKVDYTEIRQVLDYIMRYLGMDCTLEEADHPSFIEGRCARAIVKGVKVAYLGEIHPKVLENWRLEAPVAAMELNLTELFRMCN